MNNSFRNFFAGLSVLFALPLAAVILYPWASLRGLQPVPYAKEDEVADTYYPPTRTGLSLGAETYARNGCAYCHTQMVRPTYAGADAWRPGWAGREQEGLARETRPQDFLGEKFAFLGVARIGPDLSNVGTRIDDAGWHYRHLYDPRSVRPESVMPSFRNLFERRLRTGAGAPDAVEVVEENGLVYEYVPSPEAKALVLYLLTMRKDHKLPGGMVSTN
jgi:cytochrome c oxidase cbb3-type subunit II